MWQMRSARMNYVMMMMYWMMDLLIWRQAKWEDDKTVSSGVKQTGSINYGKRRRKKNHTQSNCRFIHTFWIVESVVLLARSKKLKHFNACVMSENLHNLTKIPIMLKHSQLFSIKDSTKCEWYRDRQTKCWWLLDICHFT